MAGKVEALNAKANDGGMAFPGSRFEQTHTTAHGHPAHEMVGHSGMSLRDWFAGQALMGILAFPGATSGSRDKAGVVVARNAYLYADYMIAARKAGA